MTPQASLITITSQVEEATGEATVYRVKVLEEAAVEVLTTVEGALKAEAALTTVEEAATNFLLIHMFVRSVLGHY